MRQIKPSTSIEVRKSSRRLAFLSLLIVPLLFLTACGKKGAPTLKEYEKPPAPSSLKAIHREEKIVLLWNYPKEKRVPLRTSSSSSHPARNSKNSPFSKKANGPMRTPFLKQAAPIVIKS